MPHLLLILAVVTLLVNGAGAAAPATQATEDRARELIAQLSHDDWKARQQAQDALVELGEDVVPLLEKAAKETAEEEVRTRLEAALRQIENNLRTGPTMVSLHVKEAPVKEVMAELSRQAKIEIASWPPNQWAGKVTLDVDRRPFWDVIKRISEQTGLAPERFGGRNRQITLMNRGPNWSRLPQVVNGCFVVIAHSANRNHSVDYAAPDNPQQSCSVRFTVLVDPKLRVNRASSSMQLKEVVDEKGNSLMPAANRNEGYSTSFGGNWYWDVHVPLQYPANAGKRIARLRGTIWFLAQTKVDLWEVPDVMAANNAERLMPLGKYIVRDVKKNSEGNYDIRIGVEHTQNVLPNQSPLVDFSTIQQSLRLVDAAGQSFSMGGGRGGGGNGKLEYTMSFQSRNENGQRLGEPVKLIWEIPIEMKEIEVPVEFTDLALP